LRWDRNTGVDAGVGIDLDGKRKRQRQGLDVPDGFANPRCPESNNRNAASVAAFDCLSHGVGLRRSALELEDVVFAPIVTCAVIYPPFPRLRSGRPALC